MLPNRPSKEKIVFLFVLDLLAALTIQAQTVKREQPVWWFGQSVAVNVNRYRGTTQKLSNSFSTPTAFHKGGGVKPYASLLTEYRPNKTWGGMLNIAFDNRGGKFNEVLAPCDCPATLSTNLSYLSIEPSLRVAPFSNAFYLFGGPTLGINLSKTFAYTQEKQPDRISNWSDVRKTYLSAQAGAGIDIPVSAPANNTQVTISPFASFQTNLGQEPRSEGSWSIYTVRAGIAVKFGSVRRKVTAVVLSEKSVPLEREVEFSVRVPKVLPSVRPVKETFPLRNSVFFDVASAEIPLRYVQLSKSEAAAFRETQLQQSQPENLTNGRAARQLAVYHNILNVIGDRLRSHPESSILLSGAADNDPAEGKMLAEATKHYLVSRFDVQPARIKTEGRDKPTIPSEQPGATTELALLKQGDRRVDIWSTSPELLLQVGGIASDYLKPVEILAAQEDPLDSHLIVTAGGAGALWQSWMIHVTDDGGNVQRFGPFTSDQATIPGKTIMGQNSQGNYKISLVGQTKSGRTFLKETSVQLVKGMAATQQGLRYSILFDFDKSKSIANYEHFLATVVAPLIPDNSTVIIHGHTDMIGDEKHNQVLSRERANGAQKILATAIAHTKKNVSFETSGFGEEQATAPFGNLLPEERFYNRTVIIDIVPR